MKREGSPAIGLSCMRSLLIGKLVISHLSGQQRQKVGLAFAPAVAARAALAFLAIVAASAAPLGAATATAPPAGNGLGQFGRVDATSDHTVMTGDAIYYYGNVHLRAQNGATLDADTIKGLASKDGTIEEWVATGHVRAHIEQPALGRYYDVTADKAVFRPGIKRIDLNGGVTTTARTTYTVGPLIQTGDSAVVLLGEPPSSERDDPTVKQVEQIPNLQYPVILMGHTHMQFTPKQ